MIKNLSAAEHQRWLVPRNQFQFEIHGHMTPDGYVKDTDYRCNYCHKLCYYGETFGHTCEAYKNFEGWKLRTEQL